MKYLTGMEWNEIFNTQAGSFSIVKIELMISSHFKQIWINQQVLSTNQVHWMFQTNSFHRKTFCIFSACETFFHRFFDQVLRISRLFGRNVLFTNSLEHVDQSKSIGGSKSIKERNAKWLKKSNRTGIGKIESRRDWGSFFTLLKTVLLNWFWFLW